MNHVSNLLDLSQIKKQKDHEKTGSPSSKTAEVINWLFMELRSNFTAFKQTWPTPDEFTAAKKTWLKAFILAGITRTEQLQHGLNRCYLMEKPFVPSPGEFISWCRPKPEHLGLPDFEKAYQLSILINRQFSDYKPDCNNTYTVIRHAIDQIGSMEYRIMKAEAARKTFAVYYAIACNQFLEGKLKVITKAIASTPEKHPSDKNRIDEARRKCFEALRSKGFAIKASVPENII